MHAPTRALVLLAAAAATTCSSDSEDPDESAGAPARSALLITLDTVRWDALSTTGAPPGLTPELDALARESVQFLWARTTAPLTAPAHASMLTGLYPPRHGVRDNGSARLPTEAETLAERLRAAGLSTAAFVAAAVLDASVGLDQGFETYDGVERFAEQEGVHFARRDAAQVVDAALAWLAAQPPERPFFLWVHLFDAHAPYEPPPEFLQRAGGHAYLGEVAYVDHHVGRLRAALRSTGREDETLVVVVADHGEGLDQHGELTHASFAYDSTIRVPLLVRHPDGRGAGTRSDRIVSVVDVYPTVLRALGLETRGTTATALDGRDLLGAELAPDRGVYFETYYGFVHFGWSPLAGWADAAGKYLHSSAPLFYRPASDPHENRNLFEQEPDAARPYRRALEAVGTWTALTAERTADHAGPGVEELRALGYGSSGDASEPLPAATCPTGLPARHERLEEYALYLRARSLAESREDARACELLREILVDNPRNLYALDQLGASLARLEHWDEVVETLTRRLGLGPGQASTHVNLGFALESLGSLDEAEAHYVRALELDPGHPTAAANLARLREPAGD